MGWSWRVTDNKNAIINSWVILISYCLNSNLKFSWGCNLNSICLISILLGYINMQEIHCLFLQYAHLINVEHNEWKKKGERVLCFYVLLASHISDINDQVWLSLDLNTLFIMIYIVLCRPWQLTTPWCYLYIQLGREFYGLE